MKLSFEAFEALDAIDRTSTFSEAAAVLHRVPSTLSYLVQKIESDLGVTLFDRSGRRAKLTRAGRVVIEEGRRLLVAAEQLERKAQRIQDGWETELCLCVDEIVPLARFWPFVREFDTLQMDTRLRLSTDVLGGTWDALVSRRADLVVGATGEPPALTDIVAHPIGTLRYVFAVAPHHPLAAMPDPITLETVIRYRCAVLSGPSRESLLRSSAFQPSQPYLAVPTLEAKLAAQCEGLAVGTLPASVAARAIEEGRLVTRRVTGMRETAECYLAWRADEAGRALQWWRDKFDHPDLLERFIAQP
ncbi:LysR family transcriptional regulator [Burkholderia territorii]|uniref:LysR family transcriptional regulator n=1 Tax=Burkholderia territorii TaxID=1503055 RepID=A0A6L3NNF9_9BURK|nr:LysR family transcriptional regulator [Burkholderia territorii]KAB0686108.1 LysR family transcriptional regulator [Burkholderia territorii]MBM2773545.1 LysR family transcriptional regulator [Burkholderia territorii]VWC17920.1 LysR family transcriptional regulator [Burkholderia territorii]